MSAPRSLARVAACFVALLTLSVSAAAQNPWIVRIVTPPTLPVGNCSPIRLDILNGKGGEGPRGPNGTRVSLADFDMTVTGGGKVVGRYDGAAMWAACACPASAGTVATITATYPAQALAEKARVPGVAFQTTVDVPVAASGSSGVPIGCELAKTTTVPVGNAIPWTVTLTSTTSLTIGSCSPIWIDLRGAGGKESPRNPAGRLISIADFDLSVASPTAGEVAGQPDGAAAWSACACQAGKVGSQATITASYPAAALAPASQAPGIAFKSSMTIPLSAARGSFNPPACAAKTVVAEATPRSMPAALPPPVPTGKTAPNKTLGAPTAVAAPPGPAPIITVTGTAATATLAWQPVAGSPTFAVSRADAPALDQTLPSTNTGMYVSGLAPGTAYTWTVRALQADGRAGTATASFTTPPAVNPTGLMARQIGDGKVKIWWQPVNDGSYAVVLGPGAQGGVRVDSATTLTVTGVPAGVQEWAVGSYYDPGHASGPAADFPRVKLTINSFLLSGWVDLHTHPMVNLAFSGKLIHGGVDVGSLLPTDNQCQKNVRATSMAQALGDDRPSAGGWNLLTFSCGDDLRQLLIHEFQEGNDALTTASPANGWPNFDQWPKWNDITHQKMWYEWLERARDGGLRVMVALATNNKTLADAMSGGSPGLNPDGPTDDKTVADLQLVEIKSFVGRHPTFMEMAYSSADLKRIVQAKKIAVVLGVEVDNLGNFNRPPLETLPPAVAQLQISGEIQRLYNLGVRYVFPIHVLDNAFGGTAIYEHGFNTSNLREAGHYWDIECADVADNITHKYVLGTDPLENIMKDTFAMIKLGIDPLRHPGPPPVCPGGQAGKSSGHRNARGLTPNGVVAIKEIMKRGMIVDVDHMSQRSVEAALTLAESFDMPVVSGHTGIRGMGGANAENSRTPRQMERISKLHGMFGLGSDGAHSYTWASLYQQAMIDMGYLNPDPAKAYYMNGAVSFGTDLNGLVKGPRPGGGNRVVYSDSFPKSRSMAKEWDYNTEGVAHYGMLNDFVRDVRTAPSNGYIGEGGVPKGVAGEELVDNHLFRSANYFWQMWEKIEARKGVVH